jgi:hypothetical protein
MQFQLLLALLLLLPPIAVPSHRMNLSLDQTDGLLLPILELDERRRSVF